MRILHLLARGINAGDYHAFCIAHDHSERPHAVDALGVGCHHVVRLESVGAEFQMRDPLAPAEALAYTSGFRHAETTVARHVDKVDLFSRLGVEGVASGDSEKTGNSAAEQILGARLDHADTGKP